MNGVDRTILTLSTGGNEQDVQAMLELYEADRIIAEGKTDTETDKTDTETDKTDTEIDKTDTETVKTDTEIDKTDTETDKTDTEIDKTDTETKQNRSITDEKNIIVEALRKNPSLTMESLSSMLQISRSSIQRRLDSLVKEGKLRHNGPTKGGSWKIIEPSNEN